jgi:6-phosphogluconate dehydrogenase
MQIGMIGLGRMGANMAERLIRGGHHVVGFDFSSDAVRAHEKKGGQPSDSLQSMANLLDEPRAMWMMVPAGKAVDDTIEGLLPHLAKGDTLIDGGNSMYKDTMRRGAELADKGIHYVDAGTSGGIWGLDEGYSLMVGGGRDAVARLRPVLETLAPATDAGWGHVGPSGSGHFVKMVHNGIEYGMMQAFAEGLAILHKKEAFNLDLRQVTEIWQHGSVVRSWLLDLINRALKENPNLDDIVPYVSDSGEGRWTVFESIDEDIPAPVITLSLLARLRSRDNDSFADKMLAVMREQFGGHAVRRGTRDA